MAAYRAGPVARQIVVEGRTMYAKPTVQRFGTFRDLTQAGCTGVSDGSVFGNATADGTTPDFVTGPDGVVTTRYCFSGAPSAL